ncbi:hypothetical protein B0A49_06289 [Cryomyces minteri]|uniref:Uncharacterized protein n=1 Tax=Cryomyces minteri TaxID=331657 RepID=A0A4U0WKD0_9PEZI|nr:hypothetical protein B0A49_06289 [Cryomyces minteri]
MDLWSTLVSRSVSTSEAESSEHEFKTSRSDAMQGLVNDIAYCQDRAHPIPISSQESGESVLTAPKYQPPQPTTRMPLPDQSVKFKSHWNRLRGNQQRSSAAPNSDQYTTDIETPAAFPSTPISQPITQTTTLTTPPISSTSPPPPTATQPHQSRPQRTRFASTGTTKATASASLPSPRVLTCTTLPPAPLSRTYRAAGNDAAPVSAKRPAMLSLSGESCAPLSGSVGRERGWADTGHDSHSMLSRPVEQAGNWNIEFDAPARLFQYIGDSRLLLPPPHSPDIPTHISSHMPPLYTPAARVTSHAFKRSKRAATHPRQHRRHRHDLDDPLISLHGRREGSSAGPALGSPTTIQLTHVNHSDPSPFPPLSADPSAGRTAGCEPSPVKGDIADGGEKGGEEREGRAGKGGSEREERGEGQGRSWYLTGFPAHANVDKPHARLPTHARPVHARTRTRTRTAVSEIPTTCDASPTDDSTHPERVTASPDASEDGGRGAADDDDVDDDDAAAATQLARELECAARAGGADGGEGAGERASWDTAAFRAAFQGA